MASLNKVQIIGNLGKDPESRFLPDGKAVCNFSVATTDTWKDKASGDKKEATEWHRITAFGRLAEICGEYLNRSCVRIQSANSKEPRSASALCSESLPGTGAVFGRNLKLALAQHFISRSDPLMLPTMSDR